MEIVSEPALRSADEAFAYLTALKTVMIYGGISDCDMEKGQLRCDANISIRPVGATGLGTKVELKNLNSISYVRDGIAHEIKRQIGVVLSGGTIVQETRDYDGQTGVSQSLRSKEMAHDYRYFPDPDLMPVKVDAAWKARIQADCPELPFDKQRRFLSEYAIPYTLTSVLVPDRELSDFFEETARLCGKPQAAGNWIANDLLRELAAPKSALAESKVPPAAARGADQAGRRRHALHPSRQEVFAEMMQTGDGARGDRRQQGPGRRRFQRRRTRRLVPGGDRRPTPRPRRSSKAGKDSAINAFKGPVMKAAKGRANPKLVDETLRRLLAGA